MNRQLLRSLPGTTFANVVERGDYDPAQHACLSMAALEEILVLFCVDYYPQRFNRHLGGRPIDLWRDDPTVREGLLPYPPSAENLRVLMGWTEKRLVTRRGVQIEHLLYQCDDLRALRGQTVLVKLDPRDLGQVWVLDPRPGRRRYSRSWPTDSAAAADGAHRPFSTRRRSGQDGHGAGHLRPPRAAQPVLLR